MDHLSRLDSYFKQKERRRLDAIRNDSRGGLPEMTKDEIRLSCVENNGYDLPELNDKLYLHFRGFKKIENLELYTGCRAIWLDSNGFSEIENLDAMVDLRCLYLAKNLISEIKGLDCLKQLVTLDLSNNRLTMVANLSCCPMLDTINLSRNALSTVDSIAHFKECLQLRNIDLTMNRLECDENFLPLLSEIPALVTLSLNGNELTKLPSYRKRIISMNPQLGYLDRPIEEVERLCAEAFVRGGAEAEAAARDAHRDLVQKKRLDEMAQFRAWQDEQAKIHAQARAEGRSLIREFTPEEIAERQAEAKRDAEAERKLLGLGVDKLAARYWQLGGEDCLDEAGRQLLEEEERMKKMHRDRLAEDESPRVVEVPSKDAELFPAPTPSSVPAASLATPSSPSATATEETKLLEPESLPSPPGVGHADATRVLPPAPPAVDKVASVDQEQDVRVRVDKVASVDQEQDVRVRVDKVASVDREQDVREQDEEEDPREAYLRQKRIADSMEIFKRQLAVSKASGKKLTLGTGIGELLHENGATECTFQGGAPAPAVIDVRLKPTSTWDAALDVSAATAEVPRELTYWPEDLDILLARQVRLKAFDFVEVAQAIVAAAAAPDSKLSQSIRKAGIRSMDITAEACRLRWAELDAEKWCTTSPNSTPMDTNFNVYVTSSMISTTEGHGGQPTYSALATMAAGSMPNYLAMPKSFPSVADQDDDDTDDDGDIQVFSIPPPPLPVCLESMD